MRGIELRRRIDVLGITYTEAAKLLGLTRGGLNHQMRGERPVGRQTEIILDQIEELQRLQQQKEPQLDCQPRRRRSA